MLAARDGEPCGRQRTVRGDRGGDLRAHRRTDLAVEGQRDHRLHRGPFDRGDSRRHGDSAVVSTVLGDVGAGRVVVRQCGDYGHHLHVAGIVDAGEPCDARWRDSCGRLCERSLFAGFHQRLADQTAYAYEPVQYYCPHAAHWCGAVCAELCGIRCGCGGGVAGSARASVSTNASSITDVGGLFSSAFDLHWLTLVPALLVIVLALLRVDVRLLMLASIAASVAICVGVQHMEWAELLRLLVFGYHAQNPQVAALLDGGGILSMLTVMAIVCISSAYAGIFAETRMLARLQQVIEMLGHRLGACGATMITATCAAALACNQTLTIMLTHQLWGGLYGDDESERSAQAIDLEDSAVVIAPLIPWSIAGAVPLATINAPTFSLAAATFLYLLPLSRMLASAVRRRHIATTNM